MASATAAAAEGMTVRRVRRFCCYWWFVGWDAISFGFHVGLARPNIEIHLPFGFFRIGWEFEYPDAIPLAVVRKP